ncbi:DUF3267 domain-containing protein [Salsuginibacillus kocurii]|uniref:DUF3267 domain-containing protein n=1 Tax=Salsuginibacillus kocurii TaxID=427078 RepID=UPI0003714400|nr:DUF3267 domain-containing protein [Salsuginibacillus kocurii]
MNCLKSVSIRKNHDHSKLNLLSIGTMIFCFVLSFLFFSLLGPEVSYYDLHVLYALMIGIALIPIHLSLHLFPLWFRGYKAYPRRQYIRKRKTYYITFFCKNPVPRNVYLIALLFPTIVLTGGGLVLALLLPAFMPYILLLASANAGLAVFDYRCVKEVVSAPKHAYIEGDHHNFDIITNEPASA